MATHNSKKTNKQLTEIGVSKCKEPVCILLLLKNIKTDRIKDRREGAVFKPRQDYLKFHANSGQLNAIIDL